jgi:hypothetical protein
MIKLSRLSTHFKNEQMLENLNRLNVSVSCLVNYDTDFGSAKMSDLIAKTQVPFLMFSLYLEG